MSDLRGEKRIHMKNIIFGTNIAGFGASVKPLSVVLFDKTENETTHNQVERTFTQAEFDKAIKKRLKNVKENEALNEVKKENETLKAEAEARKAADLESKISTNISKELADQFGLRGKGRFIKEFSERLKDKEGDALTQELGEIQKDENNSLYFANEAKDTKTSNSIKNLINGEDVNSKKVEEFFPGTTIKRTN